MAMKPNDPRRQYSSTYIADRSNEEELARLAIQDQMVTKGMGGPLPEQPDPTSFKRILDVGCGVGGWLIEAAKTYPSLAKLVGIDVNAHIIDYARLQAQAEQMSDRVEFHAMDALLILEFPRDYFDLVNVRFASSFMRTWNWPKLLTEMQRITRPGGIIRIVEIERVHTSIPAPIRLTEILGEAFYNAGHLFSKGKTQELSSQGTIGVASDLVRLLGQYGVQNIQAHPSLLEFPYGTPAGDSFVEDLRLGFRTLVPFMSKWTHLPNNYEALYQEMLKGTQQPDFTASWELITAWGTSTRSSTHTPM